MSTGGETRGGGSFERRLTLTKTSSLTKELRRDQRPPVCFDSAVLFLGCWNFRNVQTRRGHISSPSTWERKKEMQTRMDESLGREGGHSRGCVDEDLKSDVPTSNDASGCQRQ